jgi:hypothetical protein
VQNDERYIFTHPDMKGFVEARFAGILAAFDHAGASPALQDMDYKTPDLSGGVIGRE